MPVGGLWEWELKISAHEALCLSVRERGAGGGLEVGGRGGGAGSGLTHSLRSGTRRWGRERCSVKGTAP